jgi:hypothetical protein
MAFKFGADPELFVRKGETFLSGYGLIQGDKDQPFPVEAGAVQVDGMALEFNINPVDTEEEFLYNIETVLAQLRAMVPDYEVEAVPVAHFTEEYMASQPKKAKELGCDPDFNAWTGMQNEAPNPDVNFRTGSGHLHVGWTEGEDIRDIAHKETAMTLVRQMDFYLALPSLLFDKEKQRRELYGKAGACRVKPYGVEYRVLSNSWLRSKELTSWAFRSAKQAVTDLLDGKNLQDTFGDIQEIINTSNVEEAMKIITAAKLEVPDVRYHS